MHYGCIFFHVNDKYSPLYLITYNVISRILKSIAFVESVGSYWS